MTHSRLLDAIFRKASLNPDKVAIYDVGGCGITYEYLVRRIYGAALYLSSLGIRQGDRIILSAQKEVEFIYLYFGAHLSGVVNVIVDVGNNSAHLDYIASVVKPAMVIGFHMDAYSSMEYPALELPVSEGWSSMANIDEHSTADIMFTSGTTGRPKGVTLSHFNVYSSANNINRFIGNTGDDTELLGLPLCHSFGLGRLRCNMLAGATLVLHNGFANVSSVLSAIGKYGVTGFGMVPAVWSYIRRFSGSRIGKYASQIRYIEIGSSAMSVEDKELLCMMFPTTRICMHYGLTEASRAVFMEFHENMDDLSTIGRVVVPEVEVKVFREDGTEALPDEEGEICVKGDMVSRSYYLPEDNANAYVNGFFRTGDWGRKSASGKLYLVARKKELINVGGKKVSPVEIEEALESLGVGECMCVRVPDPSGVLGEVPKALLVKDTFSISIEELEKRLSALLESYKLPRIFEVVDSIPRTSSGKKQRTI